MKRLFNEEDRYNDVATTISDEARKALEPIVKKWAEQGYSIRDIEYIINAEATCLTLDFLLQHSS